MIKASQFQELIKQAQDKQLEKQKRIQEDTKLVEDALDDLYIKVQKSLKSGLNPLKYTEINKVLEKEVQDNLMFKQNYFLDVTKEGKTRIYYDKVYFDNRINSQVSTANTTLTSVMNKTSNTKLYNENNKYKYDNLEDALNLIASIYTNRPWYLEVNK